MNAHKVVTPKPRCPHCSIREPCGHCQYDRAREKLINYCNESIGKWELTKQGFIEG
ncbi:unnamed protein product, partial [Chrysoparadoxa australica]